MNSGFSQSLLEAFARGEIGLQGVQRALAVTMSEGRDSNPDMLLGTIKRGLEAGLISPVACRLLTEQVQNGPVAQVQGHEMVDHELVPAGTMLRAAPPGQPPRARDPTELRRSNKSSPRSNPDFAVAREPRGLAATTDAELGDPHAWTGVWGQGVAIGDILNDRYRLERLLGRGGMGEVYLAYDQVEEGYFSLKVMSEDFRQHPDAWRALKEEVRKSRDLAHPNIVGVYSLQRDHTNAYMVMEYLEGKPLDRLLAEDYARGMPLAQALPIVRGAAEALAYAHDRGVIHSDMKPSNLFVLAGGKAKVLDFGIARAVRGPRAGRFDASELAALTPEYASPEMMAGDQAPDVRDDVYGFACLVYELITGRHPFGGDDAAKALARRGTRGKPDPAPGLKRPQFRALAHALAFERVERTPSIERFLDELEGRGNATGNLLRKMIGRTAAGVALLALAIWSVSGLLAPSESDAFRDALVQSLPAATEYADPNEVATLVELGNYYLDLSRDRFDASVLSRGVSSANGAFGKALKLDPANPEALNGIVAVFEAYFERAEDMARAGQWPAARDAAAYGLEINPASQRLAKILAEADSKLGQGQ